MTTKRQQTMAKHTRERAVREKREKKLEKRRAAAAAKKDRANGIFPAVELEEGAELEVGAELDEGSAPLLDSHEADGDDGAVLGEGVVAGL